MIIVLLARWIPLLLQNQSMETVFTVHGFCWKILRKRPSLPVLVFIVWRREGGAVAVDKRVYFLFFGWNYRSIIWLLVPWTRVFLVRNRLWVDRRWLWVEWLICTLPGCSPALAEFLRTEGAVFVFGTAEIGCWEMVVGARREEESSGMWKTIGWQNGCSSEWYTFEL